MTTVAGDIPDYNLLSGKRDRVLLCGDITITGGAGAVGSVVSDDTNFTATKNAGAGTYDVVFPKAIAARLVCQVVSAAGTVKIVNTVAINAAAGTAQIVTSAPGGAATNPAAGDVIQMTLYLDARSDA